MSTARESRETSMYRNGQILVVLGGLLLLAISFGLSTAQARSDGGPVTQASPMHPTFALLDQNGDKVLTTGAPLSTMHTCGQCHDTEFIAGHAFHSDLGLADFAVTDDSWDASPGMFGRWNPLSYRYLSHPGDERLDLSTAEWLTLYGDRVVGGGPAEYSRSGAPLIDLAPHVRDPEASILDPETGRVVAWDWSQSGVMEMNCFLCHIENPDNDSRVAAIQRGEFGLATTATLFKTGIAVQSATGWSWNPDAFQSDGELQQASLPIQDPTNENCAACHGDVHIQPDLPLVISGCDGEAGTTGEIVSSQRVSDSGMNISDKESQTRSWDIHAERQLKCTDCHYALNNPGHAADPQPASPEHLRYDPRTLELGEYLEKPDHNIARGQSAQYNVSPGLKGTMRRCESCHDAQASHSGWLPYVDTHMNAVACETCHIPRLYSPAIQTYDWTVLRAEGQPRSACRGLEAAGVQLLSARLDMIPPTVTNLVTGYEPVLLNRAELDGRRRVSPYNLITSFFWVYDDANGRARPVRLFDLEAAWFAGGRYAPEIVAAFDADADAQLSDRELVIDNDTKRSVVEARLRDLGLRNPRIEGQVQPYSINHDVARGEWALNECQFCHTSDSRLNQPMKLAEHAPGGVLPKFAVGNNVEASGQIIIDEAGALYYQPSPSEESLYIFGSSRVGWVDRLGALFFAVTLLGASGHGTFRYLAGRRRPAARKLTAQVYMYQAYERFWHWLQTFGIVILLMTGLVVHRPDMFAGLSFRGAVVIHNVLAAVLAINAVLALFYHLTTGHIRQFIPRPYGFFDAAIVQARYYLKGIFKGQPHPFAKTPDSKLNPLQQATYVGILGVLLPLQALTGVLMWGLQRWPGFADRLGGLPFLAPAHTLIAWLFASFIVAHVYLTTTGETPLESIRGMVTGHEIVGHA